LSTRVNCDFCNKEGQRRCMRASPEGWFYSETPVTDDNGKKIVDTIVMWACSLACCVTVWKRGPGFMTDHMPSLVEQVGSALPEDIVLRGGDK
jgi:hypothetical protein